MSIKIYLIKHLDTGKGYVGITGDELGKRWYQHLHDPKGALYTALRAEGHRMTMELIEQVETREEALAKEQQYIHALGTAHPAGWNRDVRPLKVEEPAPMPEPTAVEYYRIPSGIKFEEPNCWTMQCPNCRSSFTHQEYVEVFFREAEDAGGIHTTAKQDGTFIDRNMENNPSWRRDGLRIHFSCESCHCNEDDKDNPPYHYLDIYQHKGKTFFETWYYADKKLLIEQGRI